MPVLDLLIDTKKTKKLIPKTVNNLWAWYRSDLGITLNGSTVSTWADQSGNGRHLVQATASKQPTYNISDASFNSKPSLFFDASNSGFMSLSSVIMTTFSVFMVCKIPSTGYFWNHANVTYYYTTGGPELFVRRGALTSSKNLSASLVSSSVRTHRFFFNGTHASNTIWVNGIVRGATDGATDDPGVGNSSSGTFRIFSDGSVDFSTATIAELIIYMPNLSADDTAKIETYLRQRYNHY